MTNTKQNSKYKVIEIQLFDKDKTFGLYFNECEIQSILKKVSDNFRVIRGGFIRNRYITAIIDKDKKIAYCIELFICKDYKPHTFN